MRFALLFVIGFATACSEVRVGDKCVDPMPFSLRPNAPRDCSPESARWFSSEYVYNEEVLKRAEENGIPREKAKAMIRFAMSAGD